jgi:hypothetical protein
MIELVDATSILLNGGIETCEPVRVAPRVESPRTPSSDDSDVWAYTHEMFIAVGCEKAAKSFGLIEVISKEVNREAILLVLFPVLVSLPPLAIHKWLRRLKRKARMLSELLQMIKKQRYEKLRVTPKAASDVPAMNKEAKPGKLLSLVQSNPDCRFGIHAE